MQINFTKVVLLSFGRKGTEGSAKFSASLTKHVIERMGWGEAPDWQKESTPAGRLAATQIDLEPKHPELAKFATSIEVTGVDGFQIIRKEAKGKSAKKTKAVKTELHFTAHFKDVNACKHLEQYMLSANSDSAMVVVYEKEPEQTEIPESDEAEATDELVEQVEEIRKKRSKAVN